MEVAVDQGRLRLLFHACDVNNSGLIEKEEFFKVCSELRVQPGEIETIFSKLDLDRDGSINFEEFTSGFHGVSEFIFFGGMESENESSDGLVQAWETFQSRLGEQAKFIPSAPSGRAGSCRRCSATKGLKERVRGDTDLMECLWLLTSVISAFCLATGKQGNPLCHHSFTQSCCPFGSRTKDRGGSIVKMHVVCRYRNEQAATLYQNIHLTEPRILPQYERVIMNFIREIKLQSSEMENLALAVKSDIVFLYRAQDKAAMQLSEMEEEMDQRIKAAENLTRQEFLKKEKERMKVEMGGGGMPEMLSMMGKEENRATAQVTHLLLALRQPTAQTAETRKRVREARLRVRDSESESISELETQGVKVGVREAKRAETQATLCELKRQYESEVCELHLKVQKMQKENQRLKKELLESHTNIAFLQSELDSLKSDYTDQSINCERQPRVMARSYQESIGNRISWSDFTHTKSLSAGRYSALRYLATRPGRINLHITALSANRKLHDSNDGLRSALETSLSKFNQCLGVPPYPVLRPCTKPHLCDPISTAANESQLCGALSVSPWLLLSAALMRGQTSPGSSFSLSTPKFSDLHSPYDRMSRSSFQEEDCDSLALCDPMRRPSCEVESLPESCFDSGLSTLRDSNGYDSETDTRQHKPRQPDNLGEDASDTDVPDIRDEVAFGSDSGSVLDWKPSDPVSRSSSGASARKCLTAISAQEDTGDSGVKLTGTERTYKIVLAGDAAVGKSSFLLRLCKNEFRGNGSATLGVDFQMKTLVVDGEPTVLQLWDTAGQERFRSIAKSYFRRADGVLLLYDVTCEKSFLNVREWVDMIEDVSQDGIPIMLVGNKADLRQQALQEGITCVPTSYGEKLAMTYNSLFCETSAKEGSNVIEAVLHLAREVTKQIHEDEDMDSVTSLSGMHTRKISNLTCCTG
ncbi:hypothetical protein JZ751_029683 [Albula glossodonta]|uniref:EF-hand domain-containing protein n=1 Tax=Albula glossodonta TaxID=121402 RepID=A0A8T2N9V8_9TELE|nr:hypothetical protein JZ751_029683 [Albula glossodonta]